MLQQQLASLEQEVVRIRQERDAVATDLVGCRKQLAEAAEQVADATGTLAVKSIYACTSA